MKKNIKMNVPGLIARQLFPLSPCANAYLVYSLFKQHKCDILPHNECCNLLGKNLESALESCKKNT